MSLVNFKGQITIHKTDRDTGKDLAGATFDLYQKLQSGDIKIASELVTDANGNITYAGLDAGNYYIIETSAPAGYELDSAPQDVTVNGDNIQPTINISNSETTGEVLLTKIDSDTGATLQGAVFTLYDSKGTLIKSGLVTDASGKIMYDGLKPGNYYFKETQAPTGYLLNSNKIGFTIVLQVVPQVAQVSVENSAITGAVVLTKTDSDTGKILAGAIFSLFKKRRGFNQVWTDYRF
ncbi:MSCRAMM family protein [Lactococcus fujiensis]|uniref:MSCRAMM family protein n=1 Tax=Lactococcus fujiensis TaxID=610251 RepID=UPI0006D1BB50|nr:SpaA isopeptide-forming pilin-related protein [Lactococcus fujiensis]